LVLVGLTSGLAARAQDVVIPPTLLLPNYDRVYPGLTEALEGGAYVARARNAPAVFYNPAGIAAAERSALNASAQGYQLTTIGGTGFQQSSPVSSFTTIPSFVGVVLGRDAIDWEQVRLGFAVVNPVAWDQSIVATSLGDPGVRASYSVHSTFSTIVPTFSAGWRIASTLRLGASLEFPYTSINDQGQLSGENTTATSTASTLRVLAAGGHTLHLVGVAGAQWTAFPWLDLALLLRSPGLKIMSGGSFQYEATTLRTSGTTRHTFFQDPSAEFDYKQPLEVVAGTAFTFGPVQFELDVRWHDGTHSYTLLSSAQQIRVVDTTSGVPVVSNAPFPGVKYRSRQVWNGSLGGHVNVGERFTISAGAYLDYSPADPATTVFKHVDLLGFRVGVSFHLAKLAVSLGAGWEHGSAPEDLAPGDSVLPTVAGNLTLTTFSLLFSVSYQF
jgi:hypothetical protein